MHTFGNRRAIAIGRRKPPVRDALPVPAPGVGQPAREVFLAVSASCMVPPMPVILRRAGAFAGWLTVVVGIALTGCASAPPSGGGASSPRAPGAIDPGRDGPEASPPSGLDQVPDAAPRVEPIRSGGPNKPYEVFGRGYVPFTQDRAFSERGLASWYGRKFQGKPTASGEIYDMYAMTAAHPTLPIPSYARVRNPVNNREIVVRVNDRGPFHPGRVIDLSYTAALKLDLLRAVGPVEVERITYEDIRTGAWRRPADVDGTRLAASAGASSTNDATSAAGLQRDGAAGAAMSRVDPGIERSIPSGEARDPAAAEPKPIAAREPRVARAPATGSSVARVAGTAAVAVPSDLQGALVSATTLGADAANDTSAEGAGNREREPLRPQAGATTVASSQAPLMSASTPPLIDPAAMSRAAPVADGPPGQAYTRPARGYWVQLGAFRERDGATALQRRATGALEALSPLLAVFNESAWFRLQAGPYASREEARGAADSIRAALQLMTVIVERR
jgi:rare lipoprotein A